MEESPLQLVARRWPRVLGVLERADAPGSVEVVTGRPEPTLAIDGIWLTSAYDRAAEARLQARLVPAGAREAWVYGVALGDLPRELLSRAELERLHVVVLAPGAARVALERFEHGDWLGDPRVELHAAEEVGEVRAPFAAAPGALRLAEGEAEARLRDRVELELATPFIRRRLAERDGELGLAMEANRATIAADGDAAELFGTRRGERVLVAGAGPSRWSWRAARARA